MIKLSPVEHKFIRSLINKTKILLAKNRHDWLGFENVYPNALYTRSCMGLLASQNGRDRSDLVLECREFLPFQFYVLILFYQAFQKSNFETY